MKRITVAILANEFMTPEIGRVGGFGWAARQVVLMEALATGLPVVTTRDRPNQLAVLLLGVWQVPNAADYARSLVSR